MKILGFINRNTSGFSNTRTLTTLYISLVRSILEYASIVWSPFNVSSIERINKIQNKFLKMVSFRCGTNSTYLKSLTERRINFDVTFIFKLFNGLIDAPDLLSKLPLAVPSYNSRYPIIFKCKFHATNYGYAAPLDRACRTLNNISNVDLFFDSLPSILYKL